MSTLSIFTNFEVTAMFSMSKVYSHTLELKIHITFLVAITYFIELKINVCFQKVKSDLNSKDQNISV